MATKRRTSLLVDDILLQRARKALKASTKTETTTRALEEIVTNKEVETALMQLIRKGRGRFVDVHVQQK